jgi:endonuclease YncB( thermonuclease family)
MKTSTLLFLLICLCSPFTYAQTQAKNPCFKDLHIINGDTIKILLKGEPTLVKLVGVYAPKLTDTREDVKPLAEESKKYLTNLLTNQCIEVLVEDKNQFDKYGRLLGHVLLPSKRLVNLEIIKNGYAWAFTKYEFLKCSEFCMQKLMPEIQIPD